VASGPEENDMAAKTDLVKADKAYYAARAAPQLQRFGPIRYLTLEGKGEPGGEKFVQATQALYPLAYGLKKLYKQQDQDFAVPSLEGLWWVDGNQPALQVPRGRWKWKLMIRMPDFVVKKTVETAKTAVAAAKKNELVRIVAFETIEEGQCVQAMHIGPYSQEPATIASLLRFVSEKGLEISGLHHEIYMSDPRKVSPEKLKTIIRYPVS
jgi:hypothetical protein